MKKILATFCLLFLSGCFSSTPNSNFYLLESSSQTSSVSQRKMNVAVQDIILTEYLQRPQIVLQSVGNPELKISEFNRWASPLDEMVQNTLIEDLGKALPSSVVKPLVYGGGSQYIVKLNIEKIGGYFKEKAYLSGQWQILSTTGRVLKQQDFIFEEPMNDATYSSYVVAQSKLLSELAEELAQVLSRL